jgi:hypothetical protein
MNATLMQLKREFEKEHTLSEKKINILWAFLKAQADRIEELERYIDEHNRKVLAETTRDNYSDGEA